MYSLKNHHENNNSIKKKPRLVTLVLDSFVPSHLSHADSWIISSWKYLILLTLI